MKPFKIKYEGKTGYFVDENYWNTLISKIEQTKETHSDEILALKKVVEVAENGAKYKLKKLARILERKDRQLAALKSN